MLDPTLVSIDDFVKSRQNSFFGNISEQTQENNGKIMVQNVVGGPVLLMLASLGGKNQALAIENRRILSKQKENGRSLIVDIFCTSFQREKKSMNSMANSSHQIYCLLTVTYEG